MLLPGCVAVPPIVPPMLFKTAHILSCPLGVAQLPDLVHYHRPSIAASCHDIFAVNSGVTF